MEKRIKLKPFQDRFIYSIARFPCFLAGWGTGKSMSIIIRGVEASKTYPNNVGLIVRKEYTDLRDSTIKDFKKLTGLTPDSHKEVHFENGSVIMFRHARELDILQNVNLGWAGIEQAEEFDTDEQFQMLRGRLRLEGVPHWLGVIANQRGHNWVWRLWVDPEFERDQEEYEVVQADTFENEDNLPADFIKDLRRMEKDAPRKYRRFVLNLDEEEIEGLIYGSECEQVLKDERYGNIPYDPTFPVFTVSDLGIDDPTSLWFFQYVGKEIRVIDYYENNNVPINHYAKVVNAKPYAYTKHFLPHDAGSRSKQTGVNYAEMARQCGWLPNEVLPRVDILPGIDLTRGVLSRCWFDVKTKNGFDGLKAYKWRKNEKQSTEQKPVYFDEPIHDWASHPSDGFRYLAYVVTRKESQLKKPGNEFKRFLTYKKPVKVVKSRPLLSYPGLR